jgi:hypothetical protein
MMAAIVDFFLTLLDDLFYGSLVVTGLLVLLACIVVVNPLFAAVTFVIAAALGLIRLILEPAVDFADYIDGMFSRRKNDKRRRS